jgi:hypothetical protein
MDCRYLGKVDKTMSKCQNCDYRNICAGSSELEEHLTPFCNDCVNCVETSEGTLSYNSNCNGCYGSFEDEYCNFEKKQLMQKSTQKKPKYGDLYYVPTFSSPTKYIKLFWDDDDTDYRYLKANLICLTEEEAVDKYDKMLKFCEGGFKDVIVQD